MRQHKQEASARSSRRAHAVVGMMLLLMPIISVQGPANTTLMDVAGLIFLAVYWCHALVRRLKVAFPLLLPFWLIGVGSFIGLFAAHDVHRALLQMAKEVYLYVWFVSVTDFVTRYCRAKSVAAIWVARSRPKRMARIARSTRPPSMGKAGRRLNRTRAMLTAMSCVTKSSLPCSIWAMRSGVKLPPKSTSSTAAMTTLTAGPATAITSSWLGRSGMRSMLATPPIGRRVMSRVSMP